MAEPSTETLLRTPLHAAHLAHGAKMVPFAGYDMPVQYKAGVLAEHVWTRSAAGLFDVSHMGQAKLVASDGRHETVARALEALVPADILNLAPGRQRYSQLLAADGGILDDLMVSRPTGAAGEGTLFLVVNAACKEADYAHVAAHLPVGVRLERFDDRALIALQGPQAADVLAAHMPGAAEMSFMSATAATFDGRAVTVSRSGYTGEDGYEISVPAGEVAAVWRALTADDRVKPIGLGARDSLRLEAGLCLYGHDIDTSTSPIEADLAWSIQKRRREQGGFPGADRVRRELSEGAARKRVGLVPEGKAPAREGTAIVDPASGAPLGTVTSGGFGPSLGGPLAMGYVPPSYAAVGTRLDLLVRGKALPARVVALPFVPNRYARAPK
jgi:aminomethyltransferase